MLIIFNHLSVKFPLIYLHVCNDVMLQGTTSEKKITLFIQLQLVGESSNSSP